MPGLTPGASQRISLSNIAIPNEALPCRTHIKPVEPLSILSSPACIDISVQGHAVSRAVLLSAARAVSVPAQRHFPAQRLETLCPRTCPSYPPARLFWHRLSCNE